MINRYLDYLKNNPEGYWFKRKLYGWGWTPATREGWAVVLFFVGFVLWTGISFGNEPEPDFSDLIWFFIKILLAVLMIIYISYRKGEKPKWQWGFPKNK